MTKKIRAVMTRFDKCACGSGETEICAFHSHRLVNSYNIQDWDIVRFAIRIIVSMQVMDVGTELQV
jgi:hypothetical protein